VTTRHRHAAIALATALALMPAAFAGAADLVISPGRVDPPDYPAASTDWTWQKIISAWGPPTSCEFQEICTTNQSDVVFYPFAMTVLKARGVRYVEVASAAWRTPAGIRRRASLSRLEAAYGPRLEAVTNRHRAVGRGVDATNYIVRSGRNALGFSMIDGRVSTILTGSIANVRDTLAMYGPL
jgi:hypothetical protein